MAKKSKLQGMSERITARIMRVEVGEVQQILADETGTARLVGRAGFDIWVLVLAIMEVLMDQIGNCEARKSVFASMRSPTPLARIVMRRRASRVFDALPPKERVWGDLGATVARAIEEDVADKDDEELAAIFVEAQNPPVELLLI